MLQYGINSFNRKCIFSGFILFAILFFPASGSQCRVIAPPQRICVILSHRIVPYMEAFKGFKQYFSEKATTRVFDYFLYYEKKDKSEQLISVLKKKKFDLIVAIGPSASFFAKARLTDIRTPKMYSMVFSIADTRINLPDCGVGLKIPPQERFYKVSRVMPTVKKIGVLFSKNNMSVNFEEFQQAAAGSGIQLYRLAAESGDEIPSLLTRYRRIDALMMIPDRIFLNTSVIKYIILKSFDMNIPVLGFNQYFFKTGAVMSFVVDYYQTGFKTGLMADEILMQKGCSHQSPEYKVMVNMNAAYNMNLKLNLNQKFKIETGL